MCMKRVRASAGGHGLPEHTTVVVIGAGIAGAATCYHLASMGMTDVILLEKEAVPGYHATGRNAGLCYQVIPEPAVMEMAAHGASFLRTPPPMFPIRLANRWTGSLTLFSEEQRPEMEELASRMARLDVPVLPVAPLDAALARLKLLRPDTFHRAFFCPTDGVMDIHGMLTGYLKKASEAGIRFYPGARVTSLLTSNRRFVGVHTTFGSVKAEACVLAAGPWANDLARTAGLSPLPLTPCRRHILCLDPGDGGGDGGDGGGDGGAEPDEFIAGSWQSRQSWPFVWDIANNYYFRPEGSLFLFSPCDQQQMPPSDTGKDWEVVEQAAHKALAYLKSLEQARLMNAWSGLRTLTPDGVFILGRDPRMGGLFWAAGLGGHGMTTSHAVGKLVAGSLLDRPTIEDPGPFSPDRFL